ncbi:DUF6397 family protein [Streptomyces sp. NPDC047000]|uniref:DUF6397 family protein n=1 Tax=Streptomyces sp. NPDC047000 TaxID=3155474 RepID=UPI0033C415EF
MSGDTVTRPHHLAHAPGRAARELGLRRSEPDLGVRLGRIRTVPGEGARGRRVPRAEIDRLRSADGFPSTLRDSVRVVGTAQAAAVLGVPRARFTRLARLGLLVPATFCLNRYRTVVWLYLVEELSRFTTRQDAARLLTGRLSEGPRAEPAGGLDLRPRNWRARHLGFLLRQAQDPWQRAGAVAAFLAPARLADLVGDPGELARLLRLRPQPPAHGAPGSPAARLAGTLMTADAPDEIDWLSADLAQALREARTQRPVPCPAARAVPPAPRTDTGATTGPERREARVLPESRPERSPRRSRGLLDRLRRRVPRRTTA